MFVLFADGKFATYDYILFVVCMSDWHETASSMSHCQLCKMQIFTNSYSYGWRSAVLVKCRHSPNQPCSQSSLNAQNSKVEYKWFSRFLESNQHASGYYCHVARSKAIVLSKYVFLWDYRGV